MALTARTFRVFVSSTFEDLVAERDVLQREVFPALQEYCLARGARFQAIDLRWGVSEQATVDQQALNVCLTEIDRCRDVSPRPNFIVMLGDRYGWRPPPSEMLEREFDELLARERDSEERERLNEWYGLDENALPPIRYLRPREGDFTDYAAWSPIERRLRRTLEKASRGTALADDPRFTASATEQEIVRGALSMPDSAEHVFGFLRTIDGMPRDGTARGYLDLDEHGGVDRDAQARLERLKSNLRSHLSGNVFDYRTRWSGAGSTTDHLETLAADVSTALTGVIAQELQSIDEVGPLEQEIQRHKAFARKRARDFTGRSGQLRRITDYVASATGYPLVIHGESGSGKSALLAEAADQASHTHPEAGIVERFVGATPASTTGRDLIASLISEIAGPYAPRSNHPGQTTDDDLASQFEATLALVTSERPLLIFIDALDQLPPADPARQMLWLPIPLPQDVRVILSLTEPPAVLRARLPEGQLITLDPMPPAEGESLLGTWLRRYQRTLQPDQRREVLGNFGRNGLPLYLRLAFEEARQWRSDLPNAQTRLAPTIRGIILDNLFARLSNEDQHGAALVERSLGFLTAAKNGLAEDELLDLLSADTGLLADFRRRSPKSPVVDRLPPVVWSRLYFDLEPYLSEHAADGSSLLTFHHRQLREAADAEYLAGDARYQRHFQLASYFADDQIQPLVRDHDGATTPNLRRISELPFQQTRAELWNAVRQTLTDFDFLRAKTATTGVYLLEDDYALALAGIPEGEAQSALQDWSDFFRRHAHLLLQATPDWGADRILHQLAFEHAIGSRETEAAERWSETHTRPPLYLAWRSEKAGRQGAQVSVFAEHAEVVNGLLGLDGGRIASWGSHYPVRISDAERGAELSRLHGTSDYVSGAIAMSANRVVTWSQDGLVSIWDPDTGAELAEFSGIPGAPHWIRLSGVAALPDGELVSWSAEPVIRIWDSHTGAELRRLEGHDEFVMGVRLSSGGNLASWSKDHTIRLWDRQSATELERLGLDVSDVLPLRDGRLACWSSASGGILVWDPSNTVDPILLEGHAPPAETLRAVPWAGGPAGALELPKGQLASWTLDGSVRIWDVHTGRCLQEFGDHTSDAIALLDGTFATRGGNHELHRSIRLWNPEGGEELGRLEGHTHSVSALLALPDGRLASASFDHTVRVWHPDRRAENRRSEGQFPDVREARAVDEHTIVAWGEAPTLRILNPATRQELGRLEGHTGQVSDVLALSGRRIASGSRTDENTIRIWDLDSGRQIDCLTGHRSAITSLLEAPDNRLISGSSDATIRIWDLLSGVQVRRLMGFISPVRSLARLAGLRIAAWHVDGAIAIWDIDSGRELQRLELQTPPGGTLEFFNEWLAEAGMLALPDGRLAYWTGGPRVHVWDPATGVAAATLESETARLRALVALNDGRVVCAASDHTLRIWDPDRVVELARLEGHAGDVGRVIPLAGGQVVSASSDSVCMFDPGTEAARLVAKAVHGHGELTLMAVVSGLAIATSQRGLVAFQLPA